ncbi:CaiB/BaiF CoA transferase family protein [Rhodobacter ferrooxidans]|uniref:L-carnitine dehydratase/bile acid-inducible protein F n=1 Tax=Rhodobacter ferrooxidans TaxID=371731 RepID=C8RZ84_9RHOB|nr:CoA transferase [Rhodobacter sp. SW2]EEW26041.1 L-carnitine dehydratase/bile acid-inducible protein F [Rhodobacter sp. SW2]
MTKPLQDIVIIDLTHVLAGPFCSNTLGDMGAKVIKVERPVLGDDTRQFLPFFEGESAYFAALNAGKKSIALDLRAPADRDIFERLLDRADVVLENYRPGVMERLGYGWEDLKKIHPRLIYGVVSGFGHTGPEAGKPAYDLVAQARGGVMAITGEEGGNPVRVGASIGDIIAGMYLTQGVLAALVQRDREGYGAKVDISMLDAQIPIQEHALALASTTGVSPVPTGARHPSITPFSTYRAADGFFVIAAGNDALFVKMCNAIGRPELATDERFVTNATRTANVAVLKRKIEVATLEQPRDHWIEVLEAAGVPTGKLQNMGEVMQDPQVLARHMVVPVKPRPGGGPKFMASGNPIKLSTMEEITVREPVSKLDGDRAEVLAWLEAAKGETAR